MIARFAGRFVFLFLIRQGFFCQPCPQNVSNQTKGDPMPLEQTITQHLKTAMKQRQTTRIACLRMLKTALTNVKKEKGGEEQLSNEAVEAVIGSIIRKSKEAAEQFRKGGREALALKEEEEIAILYEYLPQQLTAEEIEETVKDIIAELSAKSAKDMGRVMKAAMARMAGKAQGKKVNNIVKKLLTSS